jgi:outer membrane protein assembly factor BamD
MRLLYYFCRLFPTVKNIFKLFVIVVLLSACSEYGRVLKSGTVDEKYDMAMAMYKKKDFARALPLYEELLAVYRGKEKSEELYFFYCYCHYYIGEYELAAYHFNNFTENYYNSKHLEECGYMYLMCLYNDALPSELDQTKTNKAIAETQVFINKYPNTSYMEKCNNLLNELRQTLMEKSYSNAMLYYKLGDYLAASVAFKNTIKDYPDIKNKGELEFFILKSNYLYAKNSVEIKKEERYQEVFTAYEVFKRNNPETSEFFIEANEIYEKAKQELIKHQSIKKSK